MTRTVVQTVRSLKASLALSVTLMILPVSLCPGAAGKVKPIQRKIVKAGTTGDQKRYRKILVSPTVNTPRPFKGFGGFCGWPKVHRLQNGDLFVTFYAGYWHASWPTPLDLHPEYAKEFYRKNPWIKKWDAPDGGHAMWIRSKDNGRTWTKPKPFPVVRGVEGMVDIIQLKDGTMFVGSDIELHRGYRHRWPTDPVAFTRMAAGRLPQRIVIFRSEDNGQTWQETARPMGPFLARCTLQDFIEGRDGSLLALVGGVPFPTGPGWPTGDTLPNVMAILRSQDKAVTWTTHSIFGGKGRIDERYAVRLPNGKLAVTGRPTSNWWVSADDGLTWSNRGQLLPGSGRLKKGDLVVTPDGIVVLVACGSKIGGNGRVIYSRDNGKTWIMSEPGRGFEFDAWAYYPDACVLDDGSIFAVGVRQGFKNKYGPFGALVTAMRFRIKAPEEGDGIELLSIGDRRHHQK